MSIISPDFRHQKQSGFATVAAIFILVVLSSLGAFVVSLTTTQNIGFAQDIQSARAYQAARAGLEWGAARVLNTDPFTCTNASGSVTFTDSDLASFTATVSGALDTNTGTDCVITSTAQPTGASAGTLGFVERRVQTVIQP